jgi:hydroxymethylpyrimidine pyrophosphatase-like HAD family hydrolase
MERYDRLYSLYDEYDTETLRDYREFVDVFPAVDSRVALEVWQRANAELDRRQREISEGIADSEGLAAGTGLENGDVLAEVAATATREEAFTALDLLSRHGRAPNVLVLDVDETLRSAGSTDNEIPREVLHHLREFHDRGVPIVICTGQTLENVKGFITQGLGSELVHSGALSVVYEAGTGVFTPGHGAGTKQLLYEDLDDDIRAVFDAVRSRILSDAPDVIRSGCHLQGNEFNLTLKPNVETGSDRARAVIDSALVYELDLLGDVVAARFHDGDDRATDGDTGEKADGDTGEQVDGNASDKADTGAGDPADGNRGPGSAWARRFYADADPEIAAVLERHDAVPDVERDAIPPAIQGAFERVDVAYYAGDAAEIGSRELDKVRGVQAALDVLAVDDPFALVMGDSKSDLRVMEWVAAADAGIAAAPEHASPDVLAHVRETDDLVFDPGASASILRTVSAMGLLEELDA